MCSCRSTTSTIIHKAKQMLAKSPKLTAELQMIYREICDGVDE